MFCMSAGDKDGGPEYDLYAVINHTGTMAGGHYVATCRAAGASMLSTPGPCAHAVEVGHELCGCSAVL